MKICVPIRLTALALLSGLITPAAYASTASTSFTVTATVPTLCTVSAGNMSFGNYAGAQLDATSTITVNCTTGGTYDVGLSNGGYFTTTRRMYSGTAYLEYELYKEAAYTNRWGNSGAELVSGSGTGSDQTLTVYGKLPAGQGLTLGVYTDTIVVTVTSVP